jgi:hypothetical protein
MDTNPPDDDSWIYRYFEVERPEIAAIFKQPSGMSPEAENIEALRKLTPDYYRRLAIGKTPEFVNVYIHGQYGFVKEGRPVYDQVFNPALHVADKPLPPITGGDYIIGFDFGLTPAAVVCQVTARGHVHILEEFVSDSMGIERFLTDMLLPAIAMRYKGKIICVGDPAGQQRAQTDEKTCFEVIRAKGIKIEAARSNDLAGRLGAVEGLLGRLTDGKATLQVSPGCRRLIKGFNGGYCYRRINTGSGDKYTDRPDKNEYSHIHDALQYACMYMSDSARRQARPPYQETRIRIYK